MKKEGFSAKSRFFDLNPESPCGHTFAPLRKEAANEFRKNHLCPTDGLSSRLRLSQVRRALSWPIQGQEFLVLGTIPLSGLRSTDLSGKPARHRGLSARRRDQTLS